MYSYIASKKRYISLLSSAQQFIGINFCHLIPLKTNFCSISPNASLCLSFAQELCFYGNSLLTFNLICEYSILRFVEWEKNVMGLHQLSNKKKLQLKRIPKILDRKCLRNFPKPILCSHWLNWTFFRCSVGYIQTINEGRQYKSCWKRVFLKNFMTFFKLKDFVFLLFPNHYFYMSNYRVSSDLFYSLKFVNMNKKEQLIIKKVKTFLYLSTCQFAKFRLFYMLKCVMVVLNTST